MANRERGELRLVAGGVDYTIRLTTNASAELEDRSGQTFQQHLDAWTYKASTVALRWLVWALLQDRHASAIQTVQDAGRIIDQAENLPDLLLAFVALNLEPLQELIRLGLIKEQPDEGRTRPQMAGADGTASIVPFARPA